MKSNKQQELKSEDIEFIKQNRLHEVKNLYRLYNKTLNKFCYQYYLLSGLKLAIKNKHSSVNRDISNFEYEVVKYELKELERFSVNTIV